MSAAIANSRSRRAVCSASATSSRFARATAAMSESNWTSLTCSAVNSGSATRRQHRTTPSTRSAREQRNRADRAGRAGPAPAARSREAPPQWSRMRSASPRSSTCAASVEAARRSPTRSPSGSLPSATSRRLPSQLASPRSAAPSLRAGRPASVRCPYLRIRGATVRRRRRADSAPTTTGASWTRDRQVARRFAIRRSAEAATLQLAHRGRDREEPKSPHATVLEDDFACRGATRPARPPCRAVRSTAAPRPAPAPRARPTSRASSRAPLLCARPRSGEASGPTCPCPARR